LDNNTNSKHLIINNRCYLRQCMDNNSCHSNKLQLQQLEHYLNRRDSKGNNNNSHNFKIKDSSKCRIVLDIISLVLLQDHLFQCHHKITSQWIRGRIMGWISSNSCKSNRDWVVLNHIKKGTTITTTTKIIMLKKGITITTIIRILEITVEAVTIKNCMVKILRICLNRSRFWVKKKKKRYENG